VIGSNGLKLTVEELNNLHYLGAVINEGWLLPNYEEACGHY